MKITIPICTAVPLLIYMWFQIAFPRSLLLRVTELVRGRENKCPAGLGFMVPGASLVGGGFISSALPPFLRLSERLICIVAGAMFLSPHKTLVFGGQRRERE